MVFESIQDKRPSRLLQWISKSGNLALVCLELFQGQTRAKVLEELILREEGTLRKQDDKLQWAFIGYPIWYIVSTI